MTALKFGRATSNDGFTPLSTAAFNEIPPARIIRELIQNSLDAAVEAGEETARIRFQVDDIQPDDIPDLQGFTKAFKKAVAHQAKSNAGVLPDAAQEVVDRIERGLDSIAAGTGAVLSVSDNGIGLDARSMNSLLADGTSAKSTSASGSYGVGHLAPMALSDIRYMLYGGLTPDGERIASGKALLASHPGRGSLNDAKGYLVDGFKTGLGPSGNLYQFLDVRAHPQLISRHLDGVSREFGHGCVVLIPAFNNFKSEGRSLWEIVSKVAAYNFAPAIQHGKLALTALESDEARHLDAGTMSTILEQDQERVRAARSDSFFAGLRPSGQHAYSILRALTDSESQRVTVNGSEARVNLTLSPPTNYPRIDLFRNGMWITDDVPGLAQADFANRQPFHAVIMVDAEDGGELHRLIRKAEGPMHDKLSVSLLSSSEQKSFKLALEKIGDWITEQVPQTGSDEYTIDDFLLVNTGADGVSGNESFSYWGVPTMVSRRSNAQLTPNPIDNEDPDDAETEHDDDKRRRRRQRRRPKQRRATRPLPFRAAVVPDEVGKLTGSVVSESDLTETWLTIRVDENTDFTCDRVWPDEQVSVESFHMKPASANTPEPQATIIRGGSFVRVLGILANTDYEVQVEYAAPPGLNSIVEKPVFRLEMHRPPPASQASLTSSDEERVSSADQRD